ncbi:hypothetical protein BGY98DRAFT_997291 [Russula aff. rugulosa BPL654]|nr:hypothetical protein BGY98DRAFT_997291 [Russula aff. rugulosa BPL654]
MASDGQMKPSCSREATPAPVSQLASTLPSSAPYHTALSTVLPSLVPLISSIAPAFHPLRFSNMA